MRVRVSYPNPNSDPNPNQASMAEKNRLAQAAKNAQAANEMMGLGAAAEPTKLMVSELHPHIAEADVREVFAPFGELAEVSLMKDPATQASEPNPDPDPDPDPCHWP